MIPKTLHCCWVVDDWEHNSREKYLRQWHELNPQWQIVLWHAGQRFEGVPEFIKLRHVKEVLEGAPCEQAFEYLRNHRSYAACADLLRYELMYSLGGAYTDIDIEPIAPIDKFVQRAEQAPVFGRSYLHNLYAGMEIRFLMAAPSHPFFDRMRKLASQHIDEFIEAGGYETKTAVTVNAGSFASHLVTSTGPWLAYRVAAEFFPSKHKDRFGRVDRRPIWMRKLQKYGFALNTNRIIDIVNEHTDENHNEHCGDRVDEVRAAVHGDLGGTP
jgi:hypothetical protein